MTRIMTCINIHQFNYFSFIILSILLLSNDITAQCTLDIVSDGTSTDNASSQIDDNTIVWIGNDGTTNQIYKNDGSGQSLVSTGTSINNILPQIDGNTIVWYDNGGTTNQIYKNDGSGQSLVSTGTSTNNLLPQIDGNTIVWYGNDGTTNQIYKNDGSGQSLVSTGTSTFNINPQIDGNTIVWYGNDGTSFQIYKSTCITETVIEPIPTLTQWAILILALLLLIFGLRVLAPSILTKTDRVLH